MPDRFNAPKGWYLFLTVLVFEPEKELPISFNAPKGWYLSLTEQRKRISKKGLGNQSFNAPKGWYLSLTK